ncbi:receptor protein kinase TMK1-like [Magnolia sinica]|uniref:receptor protein kinase TMK1-like n=1 Tax=Magnolia sinica TaxID=86752 RepID=UPI002659019D|nr:receptor protein kinase TMK1-like [Magnolia sinica]
MKLPLFLLSLSFSLFLSQTKSQPFITDLYAMLSLRKALNAEFTLNWTHINPCKWPHVSCNKSHRVTRIQINGQNLSGTLPSDLRNLTALQHLELQSNHLSGQLPTLHGMAHLQILLLHDNQFTSIPSDFFTGLASLAAVSFDNNPFSSWTIPESLKDAKKLAQFTARSANVTGVIPEFFGLFSQLNHLSLSFNSLWGPLPGSFSGSPVNSLWLNNQDGHGLSGSTEIVANMTSLFQLWLHSNDFSGPLPDFSRLKSLRDLKLENNRFTGIVLNSLINLPSLREVSLANNLLQGPVPVFPKTVKSDGDKSMTSNRFCLPGPGYCDPRVEILLLVAKTLNYPTRLAYLWRGNNPCSHWAGIRCDDGGNITIVNLSKMGLSGTISPDFTILRSLQILLLFDNNLTGSIPTDIISLKKLELVDVRNNSLSGEVPRFDGNVKVLTDGNTAIIEEETHGSSPSPGPSVEVPASFATASPPTSNGSKTKVEGSSKRSLVLIGIIVSSVICSVCGILLTGLLGFCFYKRKQQPMGRVQSSNVTVIHSQGCGPDPDSTKITVDGSTSKWAALFQIGSREGWSRSIGGRD